MKRKKLIPLAKRVLRERPELVDVLDDLVAARRIRVGGVPITNVRAMVDAHAPIDVVDVRDPSMLRGAIKLRHAFDVLGTDVDVVGRTCLDVGASTGGFTSELLRRGARRVYAVDAGRAQLVDVLRHDARVVNLEGTNLALLDEKLVHEPIDVVTVDLSYISLANALPQLARIAFAANADFVLLVKPMFELGLASPPAPDDDDAHNEAILRACIAIEAMDARVMSTMKSRVTGARGAVEHFIHARRSG